MLIVATKKGSYIEGTVKNDRIDTVAEREKG